MSKENIPPASDTLSVSDMKNVFEDETRDIMRAASLRIQDLAEIVHSYAGGELNPEQAMERYYRYADKWGDDILPGFTRSTQNVSDAEIKKVMNEAAERDRQHVDNLARRARTSIHRR